jgi:hypothetical protein
MMKSELSPAISAVTFAILRRPSGVSASNSSDVTFSPYFSNSPTMYLRAFSSCFDPAGRGPNSTSLRTCSKARFSSKTAGSTCGPCFVGC